MKQSEDEWQLPVLIGDIYRNYREAIDSVAKSYNLTRTEWHILGKLQCKGPRLLQSELLKFLCIDSAQLTRALNSLEDKNHITREIDKNNRRSRYVGLFDPNAKCIKAMVKINDEINQEILSELSEDQHKQLTNLLSKVRSITSNMRENYR